MAKWTNSDGKQVSVLGTTYTIRIVDPEKCIDCDGWCDFSTKEVFVKDFEPDPEAMKDLAYYTAKVIRHELIHAMLYESGHHCNCAWATDESLVDYIALMFPKMAGMFTQADSTR